MHVIELVILKKMKFFVYVVLLFAMILAAVKAKDVQKPEMLDFSEFM